MMKFDMPDENAYVGESLQCAEYPNKVEGGYGDLKSYFWIDLE